MNGEQRVTLPYNDAENTAQYILVKDSESAAYMKEVMWFDESGDMVKSTIYSNEGDGNGEKEYALFDYTYDSDGNLIERQ